VQTNKSTNQWEKENNDYEPSVSWNLIIMKLKFLLPILDVIELDGETAGLNIYFCRLQNEK